MLKLSYLADLPLLANSDPLAEPAQQFSQTRLGKPLSGIRCSCAAPHYLAGLREGLAEATTLALALGREFFVASSAVGVSLLSRLSSSIVRLSFWDLWNPAALLMRLLVIWWSAAWLGRVLVIWWSCRQELVQL